jgi:hypothetical protein
VEGELEEGERSGGGDGRKEEGVGVGKRGNHDALDLTNLGRAERDDGLLVEVELVGRAPYHVEVGTSRDLGQSRANLE